MPMPMPMPMQFRVTIKMTLLSLIGMTCPNYPPKKKKMKKKRKMINKAFLPTINANAMIKMKIYLLSLILLKFHY